MGSGSEEAQYLGVELTITGLAGGGRGVGHVDGKAWLVAGGLPGQQVVAKPRRVHLRWVDAVVTRVLAPSPDERRAPCPIQGLCGGCAWMGLSEEVQRRWKRRLVQDALARLGHLVDVPVAETVPSPRALGYRNKVELTFGRAPDGHLLLGFHPPGEARAVVDVAACLLADETMGRVITAARAFFLEGPGGNDPAFPGANDPREPLRLLVRRSGEEGALLVALRGERGPFPSARAFALHLTAEVPDVAGVVRLLAHRGRRGGARVEVLAGRSFLRERLGGISFEVPASSFFQVNTDAAQLLVAEVVRAAGPIAGRAVLELYGGMGVFGLALARAGGDVTVCEADPDAVEAGRGAAARMGLEVRFRRGEVLRCLQETRNTPDLVVADPPRSGFAPGVAAAIVRLAAPRLIVVSCEPATLARDLGELARAGYAVEGVVPVDLFPQTPHVETVTRLVLRGRDLPPAPPAGSR